MSSLAPDPSLIPEDWPQFSPSDPALLEISQYGYADTYDTSDQISLMIEWVLKYDTWADLYPHRAPPLSVGVAAAIEMPTAMWGSGAVVSAFRAVTGETAASRFDGETGWIKLKALYMASQSKWFVRKYGTLFLIVVVGLVLTVLFLLTLRKV